ncbi:hypothetical protein HYU16_02375 [Candidatus Woesearchaeota archaeon]|nr:hypothetical protein [Candidatus Woesearchaeota archaeon]
MKKGVFVLLLALIAVVIAGCQSGGDKGVSSTTPFIGGTEGLTAKFAENSPPAEVTDAQRDSSTPPKLINTFDIVLLLENVGEVDLGDSTLPTTDANTKVAVTIGGILGSDFLDSAGKNPAGTEVKLVKANPKGPISGVRKDPDGDKIPGSTVDMRFEGLAYQRELAGSAEFPIQADVCYAYQTKAVSDLCIRADATKRVSGVCDISGQKQVFNSGAPVHVTAAKESVGGKSKVLLTFNVKNVGTGGVYKAVAGAAPDCERGAFAKENHVLVQIDTGLSGITCSGISVDSAAAGTTPGRIVGDLRLSNGEGTFSCIQATPNQDAVKKVDLKLTYNYLISKSTKLAVKHLLS